MPGLSQSLDELDYAIIAQLQDDARMSYTQIAHALGVSIGTVRNRIARLVDEGVMRFYCRLDANRLGFSTPTNIKVSIRPSALIEGAVDEIMSFPEVYYLALMAGEYDLDIDVMCRDQEHLTQLITQRLHKVKGVNAVSTNVILRVYKLSVPDFNLFNSQTTGV
jgi:Lrp/AsnC family transcriptional regulator, regulator for asnA, asnC and gidA